MAVNFKERLLADARIFSGESVPVADGLRSIFDGGALLIVYDVNVASIAEELISQLKSGYRIFRKRVASRRSSAAGEAPYDEAYPEYVRHILAVGAGAAACEAKRIARELDIAWSIFLTSPSTDTIMCELPPKAVFISQNTLIKCPFECVAAGYGILFSQPLNDFENFFNSKVLALKSPEAQPQPTDECELTELAFRLLALSVSKRRDSSDLVAEILFKEALSRGRRPRLIGEYRFLASSLLLGFYSSYLSAPSIDIMPPPSLQAAADFLDGLDINVASSPKRVDFFDAKGYFRISYILGEYRMDLLDRLGGSDMRSSRRFWRRLYPDAGYWLKSEVTCKDMLSALSGAGALSDSLLGFTYASGMLSGLG